MKIALAHFRVGETDGVSLEMDKWAQALEAMGHTVVYIAGSQGTCQRKTFLIEEMHYSSELCAKIKRNFYTELTDYTEETLRQEIERVAACVETKLVALIEQEQIDCLVPNNILSLGHDIPVAIGFTRAIERTNVQVVCHNHDFWWESSRPFYQSYTTEWARQIVREYFPLQKCLDRVCHCVINSLAQKEMKSRCGLDAIVVPNVFDFGAPAWEKDDYNQDFRAALGLGEDDILALQATRVTNRKAIELAADVVAWLNSEPVRRRCLGQTLYDGRVYNENSRVVLGIVGLHEGLDNYEDRLRRHCEQKKVPCIMNPHLVDHARHPDGDAKVYSLWDAYVYADLITYPSVQEGWGNQFLEGLFARKPMLVYGYDVFKADILPRGFQVAYLGDEARAGADGLMQVSDARIAQAGEALLPMLFDAQARQTVVDENFALGRTWFSTDALARILTPIFGIAD